MPPVSRATPPVVGQKKDTRIPPRPGNSTAPSLSHITEALRPLAFPCKDLVYDPDNARKHPEENLEAIKGSLSKYGQMKAVIARRDTKVVIAGNGTLQGARALNWQHIAVVFTDMDDIDAMGFAIADNRTAELAEWDSQKLGDALRRLKDEMDLTQQGWLPHQMEPLLMADWTPPTLSTEFDQAETPKGHNVHFAHTQKELIQHAVKVCRAKLKDDQAEEAKCLEIICQEYLESWKRK